MRKRLPKWLCCNPENASETQQTPSTRRRWRRVLFVVRTQKLQGKKVKSREISFSLIYPNFFGKTVDINKTLV